MSWGAAGCSSKASSTRRLLWDCLLRSTAGQFSWGTVTATQTQCGSRVAASAAGCGMGSAFLREVGCAAGGHLCSCWFGLAKQALGGGNVQKKKKKKETNQSSLSERLVACSGLHGCLPQLLVRL